MALRKIFAGFFCGLFSTAYIAATCGILGAPEAFKYNSYNGGWEKADHRLNDPNLRWEVPEWNGNGVGQIRLLYKDWKEVHGTTYVPRNQGNSPSCVGQATAAAVDFLAAVQVRMHGERIPPAQAAACVIYGLSRIEIGGLPPHSFGGSHNLWAAQALQEYGVVARLNYALLGYDLRVPSSKRAIKFGATGVPVGLEKIALIHPVKEYIAIDSYEELRDAIFMGCPIIVGSNIGFGEGKRTRDKDGFLNRPRRLIFSSKWNHAMVFIGVCDSGRKGALILNSWGNDWVNGPKRFLDEPEGSFWVDAKIVDQMVKQGDSFALRGFIGYPSYKLWTPE